MFYYEHVRNTLKYLQLNNYFSKYTWEYVQVEYFSNVRSAISNKNDGVSTRNDYDV